MRTINQLIIATSVAAVLALPGVTSAREAGTRYHAKLSAVQIAEQANGRALFERTPVVRKFSVSVEGMTPRVQLDVMVANIVVGTMTIDSYGQGRLEMDSVFERGDGPGTWLPNDFPVIDGGELVKIGFLEGNLQEVKIEEN